MNHEGHFKWYMISLIPLFLFIVGYYICEYFGILWFAYMPFTLIHIPAFLFAFFLINPDIDLLFGIKFHRNFITHSILYPILVYWGLHSFWNMDNATVLGFIIFYPVLIHLLCDFKINDIVDQEKGRGSWLISMNPLPLKRKRMIKPISITYVVLNIIAIILYMIWLWI